MNKGNEHIEEKVSKTLAFLDNVKKVEASPFFNTRLEAKLESQLESKSFFSFILTLKYNIKPVFVGIILLINIVSASIFLTNLNIESNHNSEISNLLETYAFDQADYFELTTIEE